MGPIVSPYKSAAKLEISKRHERTKSAPGCENVCSRPFILKRNCRIRGNERCLPSPIGEIEEHRDSSEEKAEIGGSQSLVQGHNPYAEETEISSTNCCSNLRTPEKEVKKDSNENLAVDNLSDCLDSESNWNPRDEEQMRAVKEALHKAGSLYICGCPGTGKSLSVEKVVQQVGDWSKQAGLPPVDTLSVNCTSLTKATDIFSKIVEIVEPVKKDDCYSSPLQHLQSLFSQKQQSSSRMMLIIADEMDFLITKDRGVLHDLFMLTTLPFSTCILIGVANAIDLADRFLPKLKSLNCKPVVVTFRAYSKDQILMILQERLMVLPYIVAFQSKALELCARVRIRSLLVA
ncbi:hypothetical protein Rs2_49067 [Raphanus sativus]|nr:hypothetical protein Rs2_49067 [Raphanus sativus]